MSIAKWPVRLDIVVYQGSTYNQLYRLRLPDGSLLDTGLFWGELSIRKNYDTAERIIKLDINNGGVEVGIRGVAPDQYNLGVMMTSAQTAAMADWGLGVYDLEVIDTFGRTYRVLYGSATLSCEVSR